MKAEERHRLQENDLHRLAEQARERTRPFFDRYGVPLLLGLAAVLIVIVAIVWWSKRQAADRGEGWGALATAFRDPDATAESFAAVADSFPESRAAVWARLYEGESRLGTGLESLFSDKDGAARDLEDAQTAFETVLETPKLDSTVAVRALYGLARTLEASSDGDLKPAIERYEQIVAEHPGSVYEQLASERIQALKAPAASQFYTWFSEAKPTLQDPLMRPQDATAPLGIPSSETGGPALPGLDFPADPATPQDAVPGDPAMETPAETATPAEAASPDAAASEKSTPTGDAEGSTPATETPATETPAAGDEATGEGEAGPSLESP